MSTRNYIHLTLPNTDNVKAKPSTKTFSAKAYSRSAGGITSRATDPKIEVKIVNENAAEKIRANLGSNALGLIIPTKLIKPKNISVGGVVPIAIPNWGIQAVKADSSPYSGKGIIVAILDTGLDLTHPAFNGLDIVPKDFTGEGNSDENGHGTHCAATIVGRDISGLRIGVARGVEKLLVGKVLDKNGNGNTGMLVEALQWAYEGGAHIISMSLGFDFPGLVKQMEEEEQMPTEIAVSMALEGFRSNILLFEKICIAFKAMSDFNGKQASVIIGAAGNESRRDEDGEFQIFASLPAVTEGIISVSALELNGDHYQIAPFSNVGAAVSAPGVNIVSADVKGGLKPMNGTSMAAPHVAGVAALWAEKLAAKSKLTVENLKGALLTSCSETLIQGDTSLRAIGNGMIQAPQN